MDRIPNWPVALGNLARELIGQPFVWGETDCVSIVRKATIAMYGEDIAKPYIDVTYKTKIGAVRAFKKIGTIGNIIEKVGCREVPLHLTRDGDFLLFEPNGEQYENMATRMGSRWILAVPEENTIKAVKLNMLQFGPEYARAYRI
jgi:hypothetical protein